MKRQRSKSYDFIVELPSSLPMAAAAPSVYPLENRLYLVVLKLTTETELKRQRVTRKCLACISELISTYLWFASLMLCSEQLANYAYIF